MKELILGHRQWYIARQQALHAAEPIHSVVERIQGGILGFLLIGKRSIMLPGKGTSRHLENGVS